MITWKDVPIGKCFRPIHPQFKKAYATWLYYRFPDRVECILQNNVSPAVPFVLDDRILELESFHDVEIIDEVPDHVRVRFKNV